MSDEQTPGGTPPEGGTPPPADERLKNLQAEFSRKLDNTNAQLAQLMAKLQAPAPTQQQPDKKVSVFDDEEGYAERIKRETAAEIKRELQAQQEAQARVQSTVQTILRDFPEANDESHPLTQRAREIYASLGDAEKANPAAMRTAVLEAAAEQGLKPKSKRSDSDNDGFSLGGSGGTSKPRPKSGDQIDQATLEFAERLGMPINDPKYIERLKDASKRKDWKHYK